MYDNYYCYQLIELPHMFLEISQEKSLGFNWGKLKQKVEKKAFDEKCFF